MARSRTSDELGEIGESEFKLMCDRAGLIANKVSRDRAGWDYVLDWPLPDADVALDRRQGPISAMVQVKARWRDNAEIKGRLTSLERLAKDVKPSFIYALTYDESTNLAEVRIIHVRGAFLAEVLKKLRTVEADQVGASPRRSGKAKSGRPNQEFMSFSADKWGVQIEPNPDAFKAHIEGCVGPLMDLYVQQKAAELRELGYSAGRRISFTTTFTSDDPETLKEEVSDALLGLKKIEAVIGKATETRFDIPLPIPAAGPSTIEFTPHPVDDCELVFRPTEGPPLVFDGKIFGVPQQIMGAGRMKMLIRNPLFYLKITMTSTGELRLANVESTFTVDGDRLLADKHRTSTWADFYGLMAKFWSDELTMEVHPKRVDSIISTVMGERSDPEAAKWSHIANICGLLRDILRAAGAPNQKFGIVDIGDRERDIFILGMLLTKTETAGNLQFSSSIMSELAVGVDTPMLFGHRFKVGDVWIAYAAETTVRSTRVGDRLQWTGKRFGRVQARRLKSPDSDFEAFLGEMQRRLKIDFVLTPDGPTRIVPEA
jgi:hypothetical protein